MKSTGNGFRAMSYIFVGGGMVGMGGYLLGTSYKTCTFVRDSLLTDVINREKVCNL